VTWNRATDCFRHALFLNNRNDQAWVGLSLCHRVRGDYELAAANLERALDENPLNETAISLLMEWAAEKAQFQRAQSLFLDLWTRGVFCDFVALHD